MKSTIYKQFKEELYKRYTFTRAGNARRYNNMLKLKNKTEDAKIIQYIDFVLEQYGSFGELRTDVDVYNSDDRIYNILSDMSATGKMISAIGNLRNKISELVQYCDDMESKNTPEWQIIASRNGWKPCN